MISAQWSLTGKRLVTHGADNMVKVLDPVTAEPIATWMVHQHRVTSLAINALCTDVRGKKPHTTRTRLLANTRRVACAQIVIGNRGGHVQLLHVETSDDDTTLPRVTVVRMYHSEKCVSRRRACTCEPLGPHNQPFVPLHHTAPTAGACGKSSRP